MFHVVSDYFILFHNLFPIFKIIHMWPSYNISPTWIILKGISLPWLPFGGNRSCDVAII